MKRRPSLFLWGLMAALAIIVVVTVAHSRALCPASISFVGYSKTSTSNVALFHVTNRSAAAFACVVSARGRSESTGVTRAVPALGSVEVSVPVPADTKVKRFTVELLELRASRQWELKLRQVLYRLGIHSFRIANGRRYNLETPLLPELKIDRDVEQGDPTKWIESLGREARSAK